jgi:hypothetical protein
MSSANEDVCLELIDVPHYFTRREGCHLLMCSRGTTIQGGVGIATLTSIEDMGVAPWVGCQLAASLVVSCDWASSRFS